MADDDGGWRCMSCADECDYQALLQKSWGFFDQHDGVLWQPGDVVVLCRMAAVCRSLRALLVHGPVAAAAPLAILCACLWRLPGTKAGTAAAGGACCAASSRRA